MRMLNRIYCCAGFAFLVVLSTTAKEKSYVDYVDPFIGTGGHGHTFPGAVVPFGMIQPSPDTRIDGWDACSGYYYEDSIINGFSHTHLSGTGCADYGDILLMPTVGKQEYNPQDNKSHLLARRASRWRTPLPFPTRMKQPNRDIIPYFWIVIM